MKSYYSFCPLLCFDKILGLGIGANDYLAKPFDFMELEARVRSLARRDFVQTKSLHSLLNNSIVF